MTPPKSLLANREVTEKFDQERRLVVEMENANSALQEQIEKLNIDTRKQQQDAKNYLETIKNKKKVEEELLETIQEIKDKVEKYEEEKKNIAKAERLRKSSVATQEKEQKKEWEEKMEKLKIQFDKAAVESKKNINKLTEENSKYSTEIEEIKTDLEKKAVECRTLTTKLNSMDKEFNRYKTYAKNESEKYEKTIDEIEQKLGEVSKNNNIEIKVATVAKRILRVVCYDCGWGEVGSGYDDIKIIVTITFLQITYTNNIHFSNEGALSLGNENTTAFKVILRE